MESLSTYVSGQYITRKKEAFTSKINKMELADQLTRDVCNKRLLSINAKLTIICPEALYVGGCLSLNGKGLIDLLEAKEKRSWAQSKKITSTGNGITVNCTCM